jgi:subtilisin family serine protease
MTHEALPAWSEPFAADQRDRLRREVPFDAFDRPAAWGGADGSGVTVAVIDSGVEAGHPDLGGKVIRNVRVEFGRDGEPAIVEDADGTDLVGHGTACAGIIHDLAPGAEIVSVGVLGADNRGKGVLFAAGLEWAIGQGVSVANLSLSSRSEALFGTFHELADRAYFANVLLVSAANNMHVPSYPSLFAAVVSVAAHDASDPLTFFYNPRPPVEFGARGVDVEVAWKGGGRIVATGNSFAAPHIAGICALIRSKHPTATPFEVKAMLAATANGEAPRR